MNATIYGRGQLVIPAKARKQARIDQGDVVSVQPEGDGRIVLVRLERPKPPSKKAKLIRRKGRHSVIFGAPKVSLARIRQVLDDEFP